MAAFWAVFTFGGSGPALTAHGSLDLKQEIQIQIQIVNKSSLANDFIDLGQSVSYKSKTETCML
jgi:hypothetical protein